MANFGPLAAEIGPIVWGTPANFNGCRTLASLLHGTLVVGVSQTLRRQIKGATYIRQGGHHVGHWPISWYLFDVFGMLIGILLETQSFLLTRLAVNSVYLSCAAS